MTTMFQKRDEQAIRCPRCESKKIYFAVRLLNEDVMMESLTGKQISTEDYDWNALSKMLVCEKCIHYFEMKNVDRLAIQRALEQIAQESQKRVIGHLAKQNPEQS